MYGRPMNPLTPALWMGAAFGAALNGALEAKAAQTQAHYNALVNASRERLIGIASEAVLLAAAEVQSRKAAEAEAAALRRTIAALKTALARG